MSSLSKCFGLCAVVGSMLFSAQVHSVQKSELPLGQWVHEAEYVLRDQTSASVLSMRIKKEDYERDYDLLVLTDDRSEDNKVLIEMLGPALWRGNVTLKVDERITFYEPRNKRTTVMNSSMLTDNWMGSHFTNDDLMRETDLAKHYDYSLLKNWEQEGNQHYLIRLTPKPSAPVAWGKVEYHLYLTPEGKVLPEQLNYFKKLDDTVQVRRLQYSDVTELGGKFVPATLKMTVSESPTEFTEMTYKKIKFNMDLPPNKFSERSFN